MTLGILRTIWQRDIDRWSRWSRLEGSSLNTKFSRDTTTFRKDFSWWNWRKTEENSKERIYVGNDSWKPVPFYTVFGKVVLLIHSGNELWMF